MRVAESCERDSGRLMSSSTRRQRRNCQRANAAAANFSGPVFHFSGHYNKSIVVGKQSHV